LDQCSKKICVLILKSLVFLNQNAPLAKVV
jgi:hypothetical protein